MAWISTPKGLYGESGIRTHGTLTSTHAFQACTLGHSVISPSARMAEGRRRHGWRRRRPSSRTRTGAPMSASLDEPAILTHIAERVGFEPTEPQAAQRFSRPPDSTALASLPAPRMVRGRRSTWALAALRAAAARGTYQSRPSTTDGARAAAYMGSRRAKRACRPGDVQADAQSTRSPPAERASGDQTLRAQEDSNLRPLDPQSNALSRLSYGHSTVSLRTSLYRARPTERGGFEPPVPFRGTTP